MTIINLDGRVEEIQKEGPYTIAEISNILDGIVIPLFFGEFWIFYLKTAESDPALLNKKASDILRMNIYGNVILAKDTELTPSFFFPPEIQKDIKEIASKMASNMMEDETFRNELEINEEEVKSKIMNEAYDIITTKSFSSLMKDFVIYNDGIKKVYINANYEDRIEVINIMLNYFTEKEEYDKCIEINKFKNKLNKFYENLEE